MDWGGASTEVLLNDGCLGDGGRWTFAIRERVLSGRGGRALEGRGGSRRRWIPVWSFREISVIFHFICREETTKQDRTSRYKEAEATPLV